MPLFGGKKKAERIKKKKVPGQFFYGADIAPLLNTGFQWARPSWILTVLLAHLRALQQDIVVLQLDEFFDAVD